MRGYPHHPEVRVLQPGAVAPDFDLPALIGGVKQRFRLSQHRGKRNFLLVFYPSNWEPVSSQQMVACQAERERLLARDIEIVGISVDSIMNTTVWERDIGPLDYPLCSDFWPHGEVSRQYGVLRDDGSSERAVFVVNKAGEITFSRAYPPNQVPEFVEILEAITRLSTAA